MTKQVDPCHAHGMVPVNASDILNLYRYQRTPRPHFYRLADWPQLFILCKECGNLDAPNRGAYEPIEWEDALEWAQSDD